MRRKRSRPGQRNNRTRRRQTRGQVRARRFKRRQKRIFTRRAGAACAGQTCNLRSVTRQAGKSRPVDQRRAKTFGRVRQTYLTGSTRCKPRLQQRVILRGHPIIEKGRERIHGRTRGGGSHRGRASVGSFAEFPRRFFPLVDSLPARGRTGLRSRLEVCLASVTASIRGGRVSGFPHRVDQPVRVPRVQRGLGARRDHGNRQRTSTVPLGGRDARQSRLVRVQRLASDLQLPQFPARRLNGIRLFSTRTLRRGPGLFRGSRPGACPQRNRAADPTCGRGARRVQDLMKIPFRFISSCCGLGEYFNASCLLMMPAFTSR